MVFNYDWSFFLGVEYFLNLINTFIIVSIMYLFNRIVNYDENNMYFNYFSRICNKFMKFYNITLLLV